MPDSQQIPPAIQKPDLGMFVGIVGILLAVLIPILQMNGVQVNWQCSGLSYLAITIGFVWTFLTHAAPHYGKKARRLGALVIVITMLALTLFATNRQYKIQHPQIPVIDIAIQTVPGLPVQFENNPRLRYQMFQIENHNDVAIENFCTRLQLPEPISGTTETDAPPGTVICWQPLFTKYSIIGTGDRTLLGPNSTRQYLYPDSYFIPQGNKAQISGFSEGGDATGIWQLSIDRLPPHDHVSLFFLTSDDGDATNYIALVKYKFVTNGASITTVTAGTTNGGLRLIRMTMAMIVQTNKVIRPNEDWHLGSNELRFCLEGQFQYSTPDKVESEHFLVPIIFDTNRRVFSSLAVQLDDGKWRRVRIDYQ